VGKYESMVKYILIIELALVGMVCNSCSYHYYPNEGVKYSVQKSKASKDCVVKIFSGINHPTVPYETIGTCIGKSTMTGGRSTKVAMDLLEKCACEQGGDAVIFNISQVLTNTNEYGMTNEYGAVVKGEVIIFTESANFPAKSN